MRILAINTVTIRTQPGQKENVLSLLSDAIKNLRSSTGCVCYGIVASLNHPELLVISGCWTSAVQMESHFASSAHQIFSKLLDSNKIYGLSFDHVVFE